MASELQRTFDYARAPDGAYIAYLTVGDGPIDLVWQFDWFGNVEAIWELPEFTQLFSGLATFSRLILHDRRATGLSSRNVAVPDLETRVADLACVLDTVGADRPVLGGERDGGAPNAMLVATQPERARSMIWYEPSTRSTWAPDFPWGAGPDYVEHEQTDLQHWGTAEYARGFVETEISGGHDIGPFDAEVVAKLSRHTTTPDVAQELSRVWYETDIRPIMPSVRVPTLLLTHEQTRDGRPNLEYVAASMPDARTTVLPGSEADGDVEGFLDVVRDFLGVDRTPSLDTVLTTVLFTDIVDSTSTQARLGDHAWKELIERHHEIVRDRLARYHGAEQDTAGDGFYARFDGPARAIRCAHEIASALRPLGIEVRSGLHTGECEIVDGKSTGLAVSIGARVMAHAGASEVVVSQTVKDLVAGSGLSFEDAGEHELKGVTERWRLYRVVAEP